MNACIFLDIDGTLLDHEIGIQESSRIAIAQAQANGHRVCLATGRPKPEVDDEIQAIPFDGCIYSCGAMVESHGKVLFYKPFSQELVLHMMHLLQPMRSDLIWKAAELLFLTLLDMTSSFTVSKMHGRQQ